MNYNGLELTLENKNDIDFGIRLLKMDSFLCQLLGEGVINKVINKLVNSLDKDNCIENYKDMILPTNYINTRLSHLNLIRECVKLERR